MSKSKGGPSDLEGRTSTSRRRNEGPKRSPSESNKCQFGSGPSVKRVQSEEREIKGDGSSPGLCNRR